MSARNDAHYARKEMIQSENLKEQVLVTYVWLGGSNQDLRGKTRVLQAPILSLEDIPQWNYDGSSTGQAETGKSEVMLRPCYMIGDPFRKGHHKIVLCENYKYDGSRDKNNFRNIAAKVFEECAHEEPWFGIEQEYILYQVESVHMKYPIGWGKHGYNAPQGMYYCGVGAGYIYGRQVAEDHLRACLQAGLTIAGINAEVFPGQWEYQVGVCKGIAMCDQLWLSRYLLQRVCEQYGMIADFRPKPVDGDWNGSGCHTNYSTNSTRDKTVGWDTFMAYCDSLKTTHLQCMKVYGTGNEKRMTGAHETAKFDEFTYGIGARGCSVRIGNEMKEAGCGYMEDRRPSSNIDPYLSVTALADVTINGGKNIDEIVKQWEEFREVQNFVYME